MAANLPSLRGITVLLIEDHQDTLELLAEPFGYRERTFSRLTTPTEPLQCFALARAPRSS